MFSPDKATTIHFTPPKRTFTPTITARRAVRPWLPTAGFQASAVFAALVVLVSDEPLHRLWGGWAAAGYGVAALIAGCGPAWAARSPSAAIRAARGPDGAVRSPRSLAAAVVGPNHVIGITGSWNGGSRH